MIHMRLVPTTILPFFFPRFLAATASSLRRSPSSRRAARGLRIVFGRFSGGGSDSISPRHDGY